MARLPTPGGDNGNWGNVLNEYLSQVHKADGTLKDDSVTNAAIATDAVNATNIADGSITETLLAGAVQTKLNQTAPTWTTLSGKPAVIAAGADAATARAGIGAISQTDAASIMGSASINTPVANPSGFTWTNHPLAGNLYVDQYGIFSTTFDPTTRKAPAGVTYWVDVVSGSDGNNGLTSGAALSSIATACAKSDVGTVMVKGYGYTSPYYRGKGFNNAVQGKNINIIGYDGGSGMPYITTHDVLSTWTLTSGQTYTYETTRSNVTECMDMISSGSPQGTRLTKVTSIATCEALMGSWWQNGSTLYVHPIDNRNLITTSPTRIWALLNVPNFKNVGDYTSYLENVVLYGGIDCVNASGATSTGGQLTMVNVETGMSQNGGGNNVSAWGVDSVLVNCETTRSGQDGYNYHALNSKIPRVVEINCRATDCGHTTSDQCSTIHDGGKIIRVQGTYLRATAATVGDINGTDFGTESWNLGCKAKGAGAGFANWHAGLTTETTGTGAKMWLHNCDVGDALYSTAAYGNAQILSRGSRLERNLSTVTAY